MTVTYDPSIGRFISKDSYEGDIKNPLTINLYAYCGNNPINYLDPSGHYWVQLSDLAANFGIFSWSGETRSTFVMANGVARNYYWDDCNMQNGHIIVDTSDFARDFNLRRKDVEAAAGYGSRIVQPESSNTAKTVLNYASKGTSTIAGTAGAVSIAGLAVPPPAGEAVSGTAGTVAVGATIIHGGITAAQEHYGYITPEEAKRAYVEDIVGAATGKASLITKGAYSAYYTVKSGLIGIGSTLDSWFSSNE